MKMPCPFCITLEPHTLCREARLSLVCNTPSDVTLLKHECTCGAAWLPEEQHGAELLFSAMARMAEPTHWSIMGWIKCTDRPFERIAITEYAYRTISWALSQVSREASKVIVKSAIEYIANVSMWSTCGVIKRTLQMCAGESSGPAFATELLAAAECCENRTEDYSDQRLKALLNKMLTLKQG